MNFYVRTRRMAERAMRNQDAKSDMSVIAPATATRFFERTLQARRVAFAAFGAFAMCGAAALGAGCDDDSTGTTVAPDVKPSGGDAGAKGDTGTTPKPDASATPDTGTADTGSGDTGPNDAGIDSAPDTGPAGFCASQTGLAFCSDFDRAIVPDASDLGLGWDEFHNTGTNVTPSTARAVSTPTSLLFNMTTPVGGEAKVVRTVVGAVAQATLEFDVYIDAIPLNGGGGFITDWQFGDNLDGPGRPDQFGFRISAFGKNDATGTLDRANVEHNHPSLGGNDDILPITLTQSAWNHVKFVAAFSSPADGGVSKVAFQAYINRSTTAAIDALYDAPFAKAPFVRIASGIVAPFNGDRRDWKLNLDNVTLKTQ